MVFVLLLPAYLSFLVLAAHFLHADNLLLVAAALGMCVVLTLPQRWALRLAQGVLVLASLEWVRTTYAIAQDRSAEGKEWHRAAVILLVVAGVNVLAAALLQTRRLRARFV